MMRYIKSTEIKSGYYLALLTPETKDLLILFLRSTENKITKDMRKRTSFRGY